MRSGWLDEADVIELGELALDLAEEEEDSLRADQVHLLVTQLQDRFPDIEL